MAGSFPAIATSQLRAHPRAAEIYGVFYEQKDSLLESIQAQDILTPLLVTASGVVVAGHERLRVAQQLGLKKVPVRVLDLIDETEIEEKLIESNVAREKTNEQKVREYQALKRIETVKAAARKGMRTDLMENLPSGQTGPARDLAAAKVGWSGGTAEKGARVLDTVQAHAESGTNMQAVEEVRQALNEESVDAAHKKAVELGLLGTKASPAGNKVASAAHRVRAVYKEAKGAAGKLAGLFKSKAMAEFTPDEVLELRKTLAPLMEWIGCQPGQPAIRQNA